MSGPGIAAHFLCCSSSTSSVFHSPGRQPPSPPAGGYLPLSATIGGLTVCLSKLLIGLYITPPSSGGLLGGLPCLVGGLTPCFRLAADPDRHSATETEVGGLMPKLSLQALKVRVVERSRILESVAEHPIDSDMG